jgi:uncharacterized protein (TIGR02001 family)
MRSDDCRSFAMLAWVPAVMLAVAAAAPGTVLAAQTVGGSLAFTSDYFVRGISRSNHEAAVQADVHVATDSGLVAGLFGSNVQFDAADHRSAELSGFVGWAWQSASAWRTKLLAGYYGYAWNDSGTRYNYAEFAVEAAYADWLDLDLIFSPDAPRYVAARGNLAAVESESAEVTVRSPWRHRLAAVAGVGYSRFGGAPGGAYPYSGTAGGGYAYWSAGGVLDLAPVSVTLNYVSTGGEARTLFDGAAARNRWTATLLWRF